MRPALIPPGTPFPYTSPRPELAGWQFTLQIPSLVTRDLIDATHVTKINEATAELAGLAPLDAGATAAARTAWMDAVRDASAVATLEQDADYLLAMLRAGVWRAQALLREGGLLEAIAPDGTVHRGRDAVTRLAEEKGSDALHDLANAIKDAAKPLSEAEKGGPTGGSGPQSSTAPTAGVPPADSPVSATAAPPAAADSTTAASCASTSTAPASPSGIPLSPPAPSTPRNARNGSSMPAPA